MHKQTPSSQSGLETLVADAGACDSECCEVIINGILRKDRDATADEINSISFAVLRAMSPSLARDKVLGARILQARDPSGMNGSGTEGGLDKKSGARRTVGQKWTKVGGRHIS